MVTARLIGRRPTRDAISAALDDVESGRAADGVLVSGLVGSGRSRVLQWAVHHAVSRQWLSLAVAADNRREAEPLWEGARALADSMRARRPGALAVRELTELLDRPPGPLPTACRALGRLAAQAADECRTAILLTVDDADRWGSGAAAALTALLTPARRGLPLLLVAAHLPALEVGGDPLRHRLGPLTVEDLLAEPMAGIDAPTAERLVQASGGWPSVMGALLDYPPEQWPVQGHDYFEQITASLRPAERRYLETVCDLHPGPVPIGTVAKALGDSTRFSAESSVLAGVRAALVERGLLCDAGVGQVDIALAGYREHLGAGRR